LDDIGRRNAPMIEQIAEMNDVDPIVLAQLRSLRVGVLRLIVVISVATFCLAISPDQGTCKFPSGPLNPSAFDRKVSARLNEELARYRQTSKELPLPGIVYSVTVAGRTARVQIAKWNPSLPGDETTAMPQANDFRYAQVWQRVYDETHNTNGACVRMVLSIVGDNQTIEQHCWSSSGPSCAR